MTAIAKLAAMPGWPGRMTAPIAALYMGVSQSTFLTRYSDLGIKEGSNTFWAKAQLDRIIAKQFGLPQPVNAARDGSWDDVA